MKNTMRTGMFCLLLLLVPGMVPRPARAGFCAGDRAKMAKLLEYFSFKLGGWLESSLQQVEHSIERGFGLAARLALWELHRQSGAALSSHLAGGKLDPEDLEQVLRPYRERALQVGAYAAVGNQDTPRASLCQQAIVRLTESWAVCRAVRSGKVEPCDTWLRGEELAECRFLFAKLGILYQHRCGAEQMKAVGRIISQPVDLVERWCRILKAGRPGEMDDATLATIVREPRDRAAAWAVAKDDPQACRDQALAEAEQRYCLDEFSTYRFVTGRMPSWEWQPPDQSILFRTAALAAREESMDCGELAVRAYRYASAPCFLIVDPTW